MSFENTRIFRLLSALDPVTLNRFEKFIYSPYFNKNQKITNLFDIVNNDLRTGKAVRSKEELWEEIGFSGPYKDIKFRKLCNDLVERYERFVIVEKMESDELLKSNLLLSALKEFGNEILIEKHLSKSGTVFERTPDRSSDFFLQKYLYEKALQSLKTNYEKKEDIGKYINKDSYLKLQRQLNGFYVLENLRYAIDIITWSKQYKTEIDVELDEIVKLIQSENLDNIISVKVYWLIYQTLTEEDSKELYYQLKELARQEIYVFPKSEQAEIFDALFSYCIKWVNRGDKEFLREYLDIHEWGIREEFILKKGILSPTSFRNYVVIGLRLDDFERVENYINTNIKLLEEFRRENALNFNLARVQWYKKNFDEVISYLSRVNYDDIWYNINSRYYLLASYYELDELDVLESSIDSFLAFLRREKSIDTNRKKNQIHFANFLKRLVRYQTDKQKLLKLREELEDNKTVFNRSWLIEKIDELI